MKTDNQTHSKSASNKSLSFKPPFTSHKGAVGTDDKTVSILEGYLGTGRIPRLHPKLSSIGRNTPKIDKSKSEISNKTHYEVERIVRDKFKAYDYIKKIFDVKKDLTLDDLLEFERIATRHKWDDAEMGEIYHSVILDAKRSKTLDDTSYEKLRKQLLDIIFPKYDLKKIICRMDKVKQKDFVTIEEYMDKITKELEGYSHINGLSKKELERKQEEIFLKGLGPRTSIELSKHYMDASTLDEIVLFLERLEESILTQFDQDNTVVANDTYVPETKESNNTFLGKKWCKKHRSKDHNTKDCPLNSNSSESKKDKNNLLINEVQPNLPDSIKIEGRLQGRNVELLVDTGSSNSYIHAKMAEQLKLQVTETKPITTVFGSGNRETTDKQVETTIKLNDENYSIKLYILENIPVSFILGYDFLHNHDAIINIKRKIILFEDRRSVPFINEEKYTEEVLNDILYETACMPIIKDDDKLARLLKLYEANNTNFKAIIGHDVKFKITSAVPKMNHRHYSVPMKYIEGAKAELERLVNEDIIEPSCSSVSSPAFLIPKKNGELRLVIDYRAINNHIEDDLYIIPKIDECLIKMKDSKVFTQIDLRNGFNQLNLDEESREITSFMLLGRQWQYKRMPFGIKPGPKIFQRHISEILKNIDNCFVYIDDIVLYSKSHEDHKKLVYEVLKRLYDKGVKINFEKSNMFTTELDILGSRVTSAGIYPKVENLSEKILNIEIKSKKSVQKLLGILNWYRKFVPNLSTRIADISEMLQSGVKKFSLTEEQKNELMTIVDELKKAKLDFPDHTKKFILECDASDTGVGSALIQEGKIIGYYSKKLQGSELNYTIVEKEYLAMLLSLIHFDNIIQGCYIEIRTDSLNCSFENKSNTSRINRWKLLMNKYNYRIIHINGVDNQAADQLSRCLISTNYDPELKLNYDSLIRSTCQNREGNYDKNSKEQVIVPASKEVFLINQLHILSGHRGISTLYNNIRKYFYIPNLYNKIKEVNLKCKICKKYKIRIQKRDKKITMQANKKFERISTDIFGPFKYDRDSSCSSEKTGYILTITDVYSRFTRLFFYKSIKAEELISAMDIWIEDYGAPEHVISDNGKQYTSKAFQEYIKEHNINHILVPPYTPSSNGISERINQTIAFILSIEKKKDIYDTVRKIEDTININYNRNIKASPYTVVYGKDFYDILNRTITHNIARVNHTTTCPFKIGDIVYKRDLTAGKLDKKYGSKRVITKIGKQGTWFLLNDDKSWTHIKNLKP